MSRVLLVGECPGASKPYLDRPGEAITGRNGQRLAALAAIDVATYLARTERVNLFEEHQPRWSAPKARSRAQLIWPRLWRGPVILLGARVAAAFQLDFWPLYTWFDLIDLAGDTRGSVAVVPHPSGRNRYWNDARNRALAEDFLRGALGGTGE